MFGIQHQLRTHVTHPSPTCLTALVVRENYEVLLHLDEDCPLAIFSIQTPAHSRCECT